MAIGGLNHLEVYLTMDNDKTTSPIQRFPGNEQGTIYTRKVRAGEVLNFSDNWEISWTGKTGIGARIELRIVKLPEIRVTHQRENP